MSDLILHIGMPKTGSTALQTFFMENRGRLLEHGVVFPLFSQQRFNTVGSNGQFLLKYCSNVFQGVEPRSEIDGFDENWRILRESLSSSSRVILSEELFFYKFPGTREDSTERWRLIRDTVKELGAGSIRVICYLRRQDEYFSSLWRQSISVAHTYDSFPRALGSFRTADYALKLRLIEDALGDDHTLVPRVYGAGRYKGDELIRDFCQAAEIPWDDGFAFTTSLENPSITFDVAEAARIYNRAIERESSLCIDVIRPLLRELSQERPDPRGINPYSPEQLLRLSELSAEPNRRLFDDWFDGQDVFGPFEAVGPHWEPDRAWVAECRRRIEAQLKKQGPSIWIPIKKSSIGQLVREAFSTVTQ